MEPRVYNNRYLKKHSLYAKCHDALNKIATKDSSCDHYFDPNIDCLDIDKYEVSVGNGQQKKTADTVIAVSRCDNKKLSDSCLLLVELRLRYKNACNLSKHELEEKVIHTKELLGAELPINKESIFVFTDKVAPQAKFVIGAFRRQGGIAKYFEAYSIKDFSDNIKSYDELPYNPIYKRENISADILSLETKENWGMIFDSFRFYIGEIGRFYGSNVYECENLKEIVKGEWERFRERHPQLKDDDDEINALIIQDEVSNLLS